MKSEGAISVFQAYECTNPFCRMRFSTDLSVTQINHCPNCGSSMAISGMPYSNFQRLPDAEMMSGVECHLILDNLRSAQNVGSIFRTANGAGVQHIHCCGTSPTPEHNGVRKASLGAEKSTPWSYHPNTPLLVESLKSSGFRIIALESTEISTSLLDLEIGTEFFEEIALVLGNEISGIDPVILSYADQIVHIPMTGIKTSINVAVTVGIALYSLIAQIASKRLK